MTSIELPGPPHDRDVCQHNHNQQSEHRRNTATTAARVHHFGFYRDGYRRIGGHVGCRTLILQPFLHNWDRWRSP